MVDIDTASGEELQRLPGVGPKVAEAIIQTRDSEGRMTRELLSAIPHFRSSQELWSMARFSKSETEKSEVEIGEREPVDDAKETIQRLTTAIDQGIQARLSGPPLTPFDSFKSRESGARPRYKESWEENIQQPGARPRYKESWEENVQQPYPGNPPMPTHSATYPGRDGRVEGGGYSC